MSTRIMRVILHLALFLICSYQSVAQNKLTNEGFTPDIEWGEGSIMLNDGKELKGMVRYNDKKGILSFENGSDSKSMTSRNVTGFEFFDERLQKQRIFFSLPYEDAEFNIVKPLFFEMIKDLGSFAILIKTDPIKTKIKSSGGGATGFNGVMMAQPPSITTTVSQTQTLYFMDSKGNIKPYLRATSMNINRDWHDKSKTKNIMINEDIIQDYIAEPWYTKLIQYAEDNNLEFKKKDDFLKILDYYEILVKN